MGAFLFCAVVRGAGSRAAFGMFLERQGEREQQRVSAIDAEHAVELMGKFQGFSGIAARPGKGGSAREWAPKVRV